MHSPSGAVDTGNEDIRLGVGVIEGIVGVDVTGVMLGVIVAVAVAASVAGGTGVATPQAPN